MKRQMGWCVLFVVALGVACTKKEPVTPEPVTVASSAAASHATVTPAASVVDASWTPKDWPKKWSDPRVVTRLASDCAFTPPERPREDESIPDDPLHCAFGYEQTCSPDACIGTENACKSKCSHSCLDCGSTCKNSCETCKAPCKDDACRKQCATSCADCKDRCSASLDHCATADCGKQYADCGKKLKAAWRTNGCASKCAVYKGCSEKCNNLTDDKSVACTEACDAKLAPGWKACSEKCSTSASAGSDAAETSCYTNCYLTVGCAPFLCMMGAP